MGTVKESDYGKLSKLKDGRWTNRLLGPRAAKRSRGRRDKKRISNWIAAAEDRKTWKREEEELINMAK